MGREGYNSKAGELADHQASVKHYFGGKYLNLQASYKCQDRDFLSLIQIFLLVFLKTFMAVKLFDATHLNN